MLRSPRQKARHRLSPLKNGLAFPKSPRYFTPSGYPHLNRTAAAVEARESMPPSPSDTHGSSDLRKAALLRSVMHRREVSKHPADTLTSGILTSKSLGDLNDHSIQCLLWP